MPLLSVRPLSLILAAALALAAAGCDRADRRPDAPAVAYTLLDGAKVLSQEQWRGKVVLVNFWATTCAVCVKEMPALIATHQKYRGVRFDTVAVAMKHDPPASVVRFAQTRGLPFGVAIDHTGEIARAFGNVHITPTTYLIDKRGRIVKRFRGEPDLAELHRLIEALVAEA